MRVYDRFLFVSLNRVISVQSAWWVMCLIGAVLLVGNPAWAQSTIHHILSTGQSLSQGVNGTPPLSTQQPFQNVMLKTSGSGFSPGPANFSPVFVPLIEASRETMSSALANTITMLQPGYRSAVTRHGFGSEPYFNLKEGSIHFETGIDQVAKAQASAAAEGALYQVSAVTVVHGEMDESWRMGGAYGGFLLEWQQSYQKAVRQLIPNAAHFPLITDQVSTQPHLMAQAKIPILSAQLAAAEDYPYDIVLVGPKYHLKYTPDRLHLSNASYRWLGEYYAKVYRQVVINGRSWRPLSPGRIERQGAVITAKFNVPVPPVRWDTATVVQHPNYGFEYRDSSTNPPVIQSVVLTGPNTVRVTLDRTPAAPGGYLRYALTGVKGHAGGDDAQGIGGNLRDSDLTPASNPPDNLANWCVSFNKPILSSLDPVVLHAPLDGAIVAVGMPVRFAAGVFDLNGLRSVDFYEGSQRLGSDSAAPYQMLWRPGRGIHRVRAVAVYSSRSVASPEATVTSNERPVVSLTVPRPNMVLPIFRATTLQANASDPEGGTTRVNFWVSCAGQHWQSIGPGTRNGGVFTRMWTPSKSGNYRLYAQAFDKNGFVRFSAVNVRVGIP